MADIFLVTSGSYSDYTVDGAFSTRKRALAYIEAARAADYYRATDMGVETFTIDFLCDATVHSVWHTAIYVSNAESVRGEQTREVKDFSVPDRGGATLRNRVPAYDGADIIRAHSCKSAKHAMTLALAERKKVLARRKNG